MRRFIFEQMPHLRCYAFVLSLPWLIAIPGAAYTTPNPLGKRWVAAAWQSCTCGNPHGVPAEKPCSNSWHFLARLISLLSQGLSIRIFSHAKLIVQRLTHLPPCPTYRSYTPVTWMVIWATTSHPANYSVCGPNLPARKNSVPSCNISSNNSSLL